MPTTKPAKETAGLNHNLETVIRELLHRPIAFHPALARAGGSAEAGVFLSQAWYWTSRTKDPDGWFFKSMAEWEEETSLNRREQERARRQLKARGLIDEKREGLPARLYFRVQLDRLIELMSGAAVYKPDPKSGEARKIRNLQFVRSRTN